MRGQARGLWVLGTTFLYALGSRFLECSLELLSRHVGMSVLLWQAITQCSIYYRNLKAISLISKCQEGWVPLKCLRRACSASFFYYFGDRDSLVSLELAL